MTMQQNDVAPRRSNVLQRMQEKIDLWESGQDRRVIFLTCYAMMTGNMLTAVEQESFEDNRWVLKLLHDFADYYFNALDCYDNQCDSIADVWQLAFDAAIERRRLHVLQHLLVGVNAHINYDLVFVVYDLLHKQWPDLSPDEQQRRYRDYCLVNEIIYQTIDAVQDEVVERYSPSMDIVDKAFLTFDELMLKYLISRWREEVWQNAVRLMECTDLESPEVRALVNAHALRRGQSILFDRGIFGLRHIF